MKVKKCELTNGIITIRPHRSSDVRPCFEAVIESMDELSPWMWWCHAEYSFEETKTWIESRSDAWENRVEFSFAIVDSKDGYFLGGCGLNYINLTDRFANLGYWVRTGRSRQGVATAAALLVAQFAFNELRMNRVEMVVATGNKASQRVAEKVGALREGVLRKRITVRDHIYDAFLFLLIADDLGGNPENAVNT